MTHLAVYGDLGTLAYDPAEDKVQCHICGKWFRGLNNHVFRTHNRTADEYREEFGLNRGQSLICQGTRTMLSQINKKLGNWKHLVSQTMTKEELNNFLRAVQKPRGYKFRRQTILPRSERLKKCNPMDNPEALQRRTATLKKTWYGTERNQEVSRANILQTIAKIRERNLRERRHICPCSLAFPTGRGAQHHRRNCPIARAIKRERVIKAHEKYLKNLPPEKRQEIDQHISEGKKRQYATLSS